MDGRRAYLAFLAGGREVSRNRDQLNKTNVFPVADGDTGSNLALSLNYILDEARPKPTLHGTFQSIAEASLAGARGNSGMILAQLLNGLAAEVQGQHSVSAPAFGSRLVRAVPYAYKAVAQPVEGTMLTVIRAWAEAFHDLCQTSRDFAEVLSCSLEQARESLRKTPEQLEVLRKASVVDSGAQGFVHFLEGITKLMQSGRLRTVLGQREQVRLESTPVEGGISTELTARYCAEGYLTGERIPLDGIRSFLEHEGDSVIVAGSPERIRFHVHTDHPAQVFTGLRRHGIFLQQKVDDMQRQQDALHRRRFPVALATDSIADIPQQILDSYQVHLLPLQVIVDGSTFLDRMTLAPAQLFDLLEDVKEYPTSSQPTARQAREWLEFLSGHYNSVVVLAVSSQISGTYQTLCQTAESLNNEGHNIRVIDTRLNSAAQGLLVLKAAEALEAGATHEELVSLVEDWIARTRIFVSVATFEYMVRGGRVSPLKGRLGKWLNLKPIVSLDEQGKGIAFGKAFSRRANTKKIMTSVSELHKKAPIDKYCIVHAEALDKAREYERQLTRLLGKPPEYITEISPIVALNAGRGAVAVAVMQGDRAMNEAAACGR
ncbi:MAG: DegV family protein [Candidatus Bipolaricaulota bacterium]